jgi:hypothetical protein
MRFDLLTRAVLTAWIMALLIACGGGGGPPQGESPAASAVQTFYDHLNRGKYDAAKALYTKETREQIFPDADAEEGFRDWAVVETHNQSLTEFNVVTETESPDGVMIEFELRFSDGETAQRQVTVSEEDGAMRLGFIG